MYQAAMTILGGDGAPTRRVALRARRGYGRTTVGTSAQTPLTFEALRAKDYSANPQTPGEHLRKRRRLLGHLQREVVVHDIMTGNGSDDHRARIATKRILKDLATDWSV